VTFGALDGANLIKDKIEIHEWLGSRARGDKSGRLRRVKEGNIVERLGEVHPSCCC